VSSACPVQSGIRSGANVPRLLDSRRNHCVGAGATAPPRRPHESGHRLDSRTHRYGAARRVGRRKIEAGIVLDSREVKALRAKRRAPSIDPAQPALSATHSAVTSHSDIHECTCKFAHHVVQKRICGRRARDPSDAKRRTSAAAGPVPARSAWHSAERNDVKSWEPIRKPAARSSQPCRAAGTPRSHAHQRAENGRASFRIQ